MKTKGMTKKEKRQVKSGNAKRANASMQRSRRAKNAAKAKPKPTPVPHEEVAHDPYLPPVGESSGLTP